MLPLPSSDNSGPWSQRGLSLQLAGFAALAILHGVFLPALASAGLLTLLAWRWLAARQRVALPARWLLITLAFSGLLGVLAGFRTLLGAEAGVALVMWLAGCKTLETRSPRDSAGLSLLGLFLSFALVLHQQDLLMTVAVAGLTWLFVFCLGADLLPAGRRRLAWRLSGLLLLQAVPLMIILFVAFPRLPGPLWRVPDLRVRYATGLSPTLRPGSVSELVQSQAIAFRARFDGPRPNSVDLYWRGPVMSRFDGIGWSMLSSDKAALTPPPGRSFTYELTIEPHPMAWVYPLERPSRLQDGLTHFADGEVLASAPIRQRRRFSMSAVVSERWPTTLTPAERAQNLELPEGGNPRARAWAQQLAQRYPQPRQRIAAVLQHFALQDYHYTLQPGALPPAWIDAFLFDTRRGFCEHYAGSTAFVLRASGIPARVVGGYLGGEENVLDGYLVVRQSDAHAWLEAWIDGVGWQRLDPTGVVVPERMREGLIESLPETEREGMLADNSAWLRQMRHVWESGQNRWNQWVISYDDEQRLRLLRRLGGMQSPALTAMLIIGAGAVLSVGGVWLWLFLRQRPRPVAPHQRQWQRLQRWLARQGLPRGHAEGPQDYLQRIMRERPEWSALLQAFADSYLRLHYGHARPEDTAAGLRQLRRSLQGQRRRS